MPKRLANIIKNFISSKTKPTSHREIRVKMRVETLFNSAENSTEKENTKKKKKRSWKKETQQSYLCFKQGDSFRLSWKGRDCTLFGSCNGSTCICEFQHSPQSLFILHPQSKAGRYLGSATDYML